jgi:hypothetical protein
MALFHWVVRTTSGLTDLSVKSSKVQIGPTSKDALHQRHSLLPFAWAKAALISDSANQDTAPSIMVVRWFMAVISAGNKADGLCWLNYVASWRL